MGLTSRGSRDMDTGAETIDDAAILSQVRKQARQVLLKSLCTALACTAVAVLV